MGAGVQPGITPTHDFHLQLPQFQVAAVDVGDFQLASGRWLDVSRDVAHLLVVEIQTRYRVVALGSLGLFFDADGALLRIKRHDAVTLWVVDMVGTHSRYAPL